MEKNTIFLLSLGAYAQKRANVMRSCGIAGAVLQPSVGREAEVGAVHISNFRVPGEYLEARTNLNAAKIPIQADILLWLAYSRRSLLAMAGDAGLL